MEDSVGQLAYYSIAYMQMTREQALAWSRDPNQVNRKRESGRWPHQSRRDAWPCQVVGVTGSRFLVSIGIFSGDSIVTTAMNNLTDGVDRGRPKTERGRQ